MGILLHYIIPYITKVILPKYYYFFIYFCYKYTKTLENSWKGTIAFLSIKIGKNTKADLDSMLQELRGEAETERNIRDNKDKEDRDLRHGSPHLPLGFLGSEDHKGTDGYRARIHGLH